MLPKELSAPLAGVGAIIVVLFIWEGSPTLTFRVFPPWALLVMVFCVRELVCIVREIPKELTVSIKAPDARVFFAILVTTSLEVFHRLLLAAVLGLSCVAFLTIVFDGSSAREKSIRGFETTLGLLHSRLDAVLPHHAYGLVVYLTVLVALLLLPGFVNRVAAINKMKRAKEWLETLVFAIAVAISFSFFTVVKFSNDEQIASYLARFAPIKDQNLLPLSLTSTEINHQHEIARAVISCAMSMDDRGKDALRSLFQTIRHDVRFAEQGAVAYVLGRSAATTAPIPEKIAPLSEESKAEILVVARDALEVASGAAFAAAIGASGYELSGLAKEYFRGVVEGLSHRFSSGETLARGSDLAIRMAISALKMANTKAGEIRDYVLSGSETLSDNKKKYEAELHERLGGKETSKSILEKLISRIRR